LTASNHLPDYTMTLEGDQVVFWRREQGSNASKPVHAPALSVAATTPLPVSERRILVSSQAIERLYETAPGWDKYYLENTYIEWAKDKEPARNEDSRFLSWVGSYTKGKPAP
jgi:hypothetical protein